MISPIISAVAPLNLTMACSEVCIQTKDIILTDRAGAYNLGNGIVNVRQTEDSSVFLPKETGPYHPEVTKR